MQGMVAGDAVNTASRVQSAASPGQVWVDETTRLLTSAAITYSEVGSHSSRARPSRCRCGRPGRWSRSIGGAQRADGLEAPLIGGTESSGWSRSCSRRGGEPESGVSRDRRRGRGGKSRLAGIREVRRRADPPTLAQRQVRLLPRGGRLLRRGRGVPGSAQVLSRRPRTTDEDRTTPSAGGARPGRLSSTTPRARLARPRASGLAGSGSGGHVPARGSVLRLDDLLRAGLRRSREPGRAGHRRRPARRRGVAAVPRAPARCRLAPVPVVLLTRPGLLEEHPGLATNRRATVVHLPKLSDADVSALLSGLVVGLPAEVREGWSPGRRGCRSTPWRRSGR